jgi:OmpA-OmpF porin, OOP family
MRALTCKAIGLYVVVWLVGMGANPPAAQAQIDIGGLAKKAAKAAGSSARDEVVKKVNQKLLADGRKNQCSFQTDSDVLTPGCDQKLKNLATAMVAAKKQLDGASVPNYKFEVSGHTDTRGKADHNKELSQKRAAVIARELVARGIPENQIVSLGMGSEKPLVKPDNTPAKQAKNRRYEIQVR